MPANLRGAPKADHRAAIARMNPQDAIDYLLGVLDMITGPDNTADSWDIPGLNLQRMSRRAVYALATYGGIVSRDRILATIYADRYIDDWPDERMVDAMIYRLRKALAPLGVTIQTHYALGYTIHTPPGFVWPWVDLPAQAIAQIHKLR